MEDIHSVYKINVDAYIAARDNTLAAYAPVADPKHTYNFLKTLHLRTIIEVTDYAIEGVKNNEYVNFIIRMHLGGDCNSFMSDKTKIMIAMLCGVDRSIVIHRTQKLFETNQLAKYLEIYGTAEFSSKELLKSILTDKKTTEFLRDYSLMQCTFAELCEFGVYKAGPKPNTTITYADLVGMGVFQISEHVRKFIDAQNDVESGRV